MAAVERSVARALWAKTGKNAGLAVGLAAALIISAPSWAQGNGASPLDSLHQALHLSPDQEQAWQAYRAQASAPSAAQGRHQAAMQMFPRLSAPQRLDLVEAEMKQELVDLERQANVLKAFYANLSPEQKATFDAQTLPPANSGQQGQ